MAGNGDLHFVVPDKLMACKGPSEAVPPGHTWIDQDCTRIFHPAFYIDIFREMGVSTIVRLNNAEYDAHIFKAAGMQHIDLFFADCSLPPPDIVVSFLDIVERSPGAVAVHCKAGLGRTGTLTEHVSLAWE